MPPVRRAWPPAWRWGDLVLLVVDSDLTRADLEALSTLLEAASLAGAQPRRPLAGTGPRRTAAQHSRSPASGSADHRCRRGTRNPQIQADGRVRGAISAPQVQDLRQQLCQQLENEHPAAGDRVAAPRRSLPGICQHLRLRQHRNTAQSLIGRYAAAKPLVLPSTRRWPWTWQAAASTPPWCCNSAVSITCR